MVRAVDATLTDARTAVAVAFGANGFCFATWLSRMPAVRDTLSLSSVQLGLLLLCLSGGACMALPVAGPLVHRWGPARTVLVASVVLGVGLLALAAGLASATVWPAAVGLVLAGIGNSNWDVAMNVAGADVERRRSRSLMPRLHAAFSLGTVAGAGAGAGAAVTGVPVQVQVVVAAVLAPIAMAIAVWFFAAQLAPDADPAAAGDVRNADGERRKSGGLRAWREPRTLLVGLLTLAFAFTEGTANDWLAVAMVDGHGASQTMGAVGFGVFVTAMTVGRLLGGSLLDRFGRVAVLRATAAVALAGLLLVITAASAGLALVGAALWGVGAALGFPVGMSAASDDPTRAAARVGVVSSIAYTAFLAGPPLIGLLAEHTGILRALFVVLGALTVGLLAASAARPPAQDQRPPTGTPSC